MADNAAELGPSVLGRPFSGPDADRVTTPAAAEESTTTPTASASASGSEAGAEPARPKSKQAGAAALERNLAKWAGKARKTVADTAKVVYDAVPQVDAPTADNSVSMDAPPDLERGLSQSTADSQSHGSGSKFEKWANSASSAAAKLGKKVAKEAGKAKAGLGEAAEKTGIGEAAEKAKCAWNQSEMKGHFKSVAEGAASAGATLQEKGNLVKQKTTELTENTQQKLKDAGTASATKAREAKDKAANAADAAKGAAAAAGSKAKGAAVGAAGAAKGAAGAAKGRLSNVRDNITCTGALLASPAKLAKFAGIFFLGSMFITLSLSFLPVLPIAPQKFALLFAFGSFILLSSFAVLKGPKAFFESLLQREKLPFSGSYAVGLVGTLIATIGLRSYLLTAFFAVLQAFGLLYFVASYVPGGQTILNKCGKCCGAICSRLACTVCRGHS